MLWNILGSFVSFQIWSRCGDRRRSWSAKLMHLHGKRHMNYWLKVWIEAKIIKNKYEDEIPQVLSIPLARQSLRYVQCQVCSSSSHSLRLIAYSSPAAAASASSVSSLPGFELRYSFLFWGSTVSKGSSPSFPDGCLEKNTPLSSPFHQHIAKY
jgi:hypothetical protein